MTRLLDCPPARLPMLRGAELVDAIRGSEGRTVAAEVIATAPGLLDSVSNVELAAAAGADILVLNLFDPADPVVAGLPDAEGTAASRAFGDVAHGRGRTLADVAAWTGRVVGVNVEPGKRCGWQATPEVARAMADAGAQIIVVTGNPGSGVSIGGIADAVAGMREVTGESVVYLAGRMHGAGIDGPVVTDADIAALADAGTDIVLLPAPGTTPGASEAASARWIAQVHERGLLAWNSIGTSQEGASVRVVEQIALMSKMAGADVHHIGDSGYFGVAPPQNIYTYSVAVRGRRHTWTRIAASARR